MATNNKPPPTVGEPTEQNRHIQNVSNTQNRVEFKVPILLKGFQKENKTQQLTSVEKATWSTTKSRSPKSQVQELG